MVYGYLRVSSDEQDVNSQKQGVDSFAAAKGWTIEQYISDEGVSGGKDPNKRKLGPMLKKIKGGDIVICSEISRLGRDLYMVMDILHFCMTREAVIYTVKDGFVLGDSIQSKVLAFAFGLSAEIERQMIRQRTKEGLALRRKLGVLMGRRPTDGFVGSKKVGAKVMRYKELILEHYRAGMSQRKIAKLFRVDKNTLMRYIIGWGEYRGKNEGMREKTRMRWDEQQRNRREHNNSGKWTALPDPGILRHRIKALIMEDKTIPTIAQEFPDYSYDVVYGWIEQDKELNMLYREHGQKLARKNYERERR